MIVAVTGAAGLVGARACAALTAAGHCVRRLTRTPSEANERAFHLGEAVTPEILSGCNALIHAAYDFKVLGWAEVNRVNVEGSFRLLTAAKTAGVKRIIFVSSVSAFKDCRSDYGKGKLAVEKVVLNSGGIVVRPGLVYGGNGGMFASLAKLCAVPLLPVFDGGRQPLQLVHVDEVARDLVAALNWDPSSAAGPVTLANPGPISFKNMFAAIARSQGKTLRTISIPSSLAYVGLRALEALGLPLRLRADSLVGLLNYNPSFDWSPHARLGLTYRRFLDEAPDEAGPKLVQ